MQSNQDGNKVKLRAGTLVRYRLLIAILVALVSLNVCGNARADWRTDIGVFRIGIVAGEDVAGSIARVEPFRLALAEALAMKVEIFPARNMSSLIEAHRSLRIEYAIYSASAYAATWVLCECVEPLVLPLAMDQTSTFRSVIISAPSGPGSLGDLQLENLAVPRSTGVGGFEIAAYELAKLGVLFEPSAEGELISSEQALNAVLEGQFGALLGWSSMVGDRFSGYSRGSLRALAARNGGDITGYKIIWQSSDVPHPPHAVRKNLPGEAKEILRQTLQQMFADDPSAYDSIELQYGGGFGVARHEQFSSMLDFVRAKMGIKGASSEVTGEVADTGEISKE